MFGRCSSAFDYYVDNTYLHKKIIRLYHEFEAVVTIYKALKVYAVKCSIHTVIDNYVIE